MPTQPYHVELEKRLFADLRKVREWARRHRMTIRTTGKDWQPKHFDLRRRGDPTILVRTSANSLDGIKMFLTRLESAESANRRAATSAALTEIVR
jgi:hypothetical protein